MSELFAGTIDDVSYEPAPMAFEEWQSRLLSLEKLTTSLPWWIGDLLQYGEGHFGEKYTQALPDLPYKQEYLYQCHYLARLFPKERRHAGLSWSHHVCVMSLSATQQDAMLYQAETEGWTVRDLRAQVKMTKHQLREDTGKVDPLDPEVATWFQFLPEQCVKLYSAQGGSWSSDRLIGGKTVHLHLEISWEEPSP
jgi:hypothetical protein